MVKCLVLHEKIIELHKCGLSNAAIGKRLLEAKGTVRDIVHHWKTTGNIEPKPKSGRPRSVRTPQLIMKDRNKIRCNPNRSITKLAQQHDVSENCFKFSLKIMNYGYTEIIHQ